MNSLKLFVAGIPQPQPKFETSSGRTKDGGVWHRVYPRDKTGEKQAWVRYIQTIVGTALRQGGMSLPVGKDYWVSLNLTFVLPRPASAKKREKPNVKPDASNYYYAVENALKEILYEDDAQVTEFSCRKIYDDHHESGVQIEVTWGLNVNAS